MKRTFIFLACFLGVISAGLVSVAAHIAVASPSAMQYGRTTNCPMLATLLTGLGLFGCFVFAPRGKRKRLVSTFASAVACLFIVGTLFASTACGGYSKNSQTNRGTASIMVTAMSGTMIHTTTLSLTVQ